MLLITILQIFDFLLWVVQAMLIVQFVLSLLISFNVVNMHNQFVASLWRALNVLIDPMLNPIRRLMPDTGAIDFSPMVLIIIVFILRRIILPNLAGALA